MDNMLIGHIIVSIITVICFCAIPLICQMWDK